MRCLILSLILFSAALFQAGCAKSMHDPAEHYFLVTTNVKLPYWQTAAAGFTQAAKQLQIQATVVGPDTYNAQEEVNEFRKALQKKPAGILVSAADAALLQPVIDEAIGAGVPVITIDSDSPSSKRLVFIGTNNYQAGMMGGDLLAKQLKGKGNVVMFTMPAQSNLADRLKGYREALSNHPGIKITDIVDIKGDSRVAFDTATDILAKRRNQVDAFVCLEASSGKEVAEVLRRNKLDDKVLIAMDTDAETLQYVQNGGIAATISQRPYTMAYYGLQMLDDLHHRKPKTLDADWKQDSFSSLPTFVDTGATLIDKGNVERFLRDKQAATSGT